MDRDPPDRSAVEIVRQRPGLLVPGGVLAALQLAFAVGVGYAVVRVEGLAAGLVTAALGVVAYGIVRTLAASGPLAAVYQEAAASTGSGARADGEWSSGGPSLADLGSHARAGCRTVLGDVALGRPAGPVLAAALGAVGLGAFLVGSTAVGFVAHLLVGETLLSVPHLNAGLGVLVLGAGVVGGWVAGGLGEPLGVLGREGDRGGWTPVWYALARPRSTLGYAFVRGSLVALPVGVALAASAAFGATLGDAVPTAVVLGLGGMVALAVGSVTHAVAAVYQVTYARAELVPFLDGESRASPRPTVARAGRTALVAVLLVGLVVGSVGVRVADVRPGDPVGTATASGDVADRSPAEIVESAGQAVHAESVRVESHNYAVNRTTGERTLFLRVERTIDREDRQGELVGELRVPDESGGWSVHTTYYDEGTLAVDLPENADHADTPERIALDRYRAGGWTVFASPGYATMVVGGRGYDTLDHPEAGWRVVDRTDDAVVVGIDDPERLAEAGFFFDHPGDRLVANGSYVRLHVDRDTGRPTRMVQRRVVRRPDGDGGTELQTSVTVTRFSDYGSVDVHRPDELGDPGLAELIWDVAHY